VNGVMLKGASDMRLNLYDVVGLPRIILNEFLISKVDRIAIELNEISGSMSIYRK
jgi:hypothetical protein